MGMIYGIVLDIDILARTGFYSCSSCATLHADSVIAGIHDVVYDEYILAARDVDGISVLCIPRTFHGNAVDDDILASGRDDVETRTV